MKPAKVPPPAAQIFVCVNRRPAGDPLGSGCADRGDALYADLKRRVADARLASRVWITRTYCLGVCPQVGATAACYRGDGAPRAALFTEVAPTEAAALLAAVTTP